MIVTFLVKAVSSFASKSARRSRPWVGESFADSATVCSPRSVYRRTGHAS
jgi:hypothetical protein